MPFMVGVDISHLDIETQKIVWDFFYSGDCKYKLDLKTSGFLRDIYKIGNYPFTPENLLALLKAREHKAEPKSFSISRKSLKQYAAFISDESAPETGFFEFRPTGYGLLNFPKLMPLCLAFNPAWFVPDHDLAYERDSFEDLRRSYEYVKV